MMIFWLLSIYAFSLLLFTTHSSPLYAFNSWVDINTHFTIGKGLFNGRVHLVDLIDNKGPVIHFIYGIAWLIDRTGHMGVYVMQSIFLSISLIHVYKLARLFIEKNEICVFLAIVSPLPLFALGNAGGSIEEFVLSILTVSLYYFAVFFMKAEQFKPWQMALEGGLFAAVFLMKFNLAAFFGGFMLALFGGLLRDKRYKDMLRNALFFLGGMLTICLPYLIYTLIHGSLLNFIDIYFLLSAEYAGVSGAPFAMRLLYGMVDAVEAMNGSWLYVLFLTLGLVFVFLRTKTGFAVGYALSLLLLLLGIFIGQVFSYSPIPLFVFFLMGMVALGVWLEKACSSKNIGKAGMIAIFSLVFVLIVARNGLVKHSLFFPNKTLPVQKQMAAVIWGMASSDSPSLLQTVWQDYGFYTASGIVPDERFFSILNVGHDTLPQMRDSQRDAVREGKSEFVIIPTEGYGVYPDESYWQLANHYLHITTVREGDTYWHLYQRNYDYAGEDYFSHFISNMQNEDRIIILSVKDEASNALDAGMQQALHGLGLDETLKDAYFSSYAAILDGYDVLFEDLSGERIQHDTVVDDVSIEVVSAAQEVGNVSRVAINGKDYSPNRRGINIVIYDKKKGKVIDALTFDTCALPNVAQR